MVNVDVLLRNKNYVRATRHTGGVSNPSRVAAHDLNHNDAIVRVGSGMDTLDRLGSDHDGGIEAEGCISSVDVVVDGLGNAHTGHAILTQVQRHRLRVIAAQRNQRVNLVDLQHLLHLLNAARNLLHIGARGMENRTALQLNAIGVFKGERNKTVVEHAAPAVQKADKFVAVVIDPLAHNRVNHGVQPGAIAASGQ